MNEKETAQRFKGKPCFYCWFLSMQLCCIAYVSVCVWWSFCESGGGWAKTPKPTLSTKLWVKLQFLLGPACDTEPVWILWGEVARDRATPLITTSNQRGAQRWPLAWLSALLITVKCLLKEIEVWWRRTNQPSDVFRCAKFVNLSNCLIFLKACSCFFPSS